MKITIEAREESGKPEFPVLKELINKDVLVVLFTSLTAGTCIFSESKTRTVGEVSSSWSPCSDKNIWKDFKGKVILEN